MAIVTIERERLESGELPGICVKTGVQTDRFDESVISFVPNWQWALLALLVYPFLIAKMFSGRALRCRLPVSKEVEDRLKRIRRMRAVALGTGAIALLGAITAGTPLFYPFAFAFILSGLIATVACELLWVGVGEQSTARMWTLTRVDPAFARAIRGDASPAPSPPEPDVS